MDHRECHHDNSSGVRLEGDVRAHHDEQRTFLDASSIGGKNRYIGAASRCNDPQLRVPFIFERIGDEPVRGIDEHVALSRLVGFVLRALHLSVA